MDNSYYVYRSTPLIFAVFYRDLGIMKYLLDNDANPYHKNEEGNNAFLLACGTGNIESIKMLIEAYPDLKHSKNNHYTYNGLHIAAALNNTEVLEYIVKDLNIDINSKNINGNGALYFDQYKGTIEKLKELGIRE